MSEKMTATEIIEKIGDKDFNIYFFTLDSKGKPLASIAYAYEMVKALVDDGYNAKILYEKEDFKGVRDWLGDEYADLPHDYISGKDIKITGADILVIPEVFANVMDQVKGLPCKKVVLSQSYEYILEILELGKKWQNYGITDVITTSNEQKAYIESLMGQGMNIHVLPPHVSDHFNNSVKPKKPIIALHTREPREALNLVKAFYMKHPLFKWVTLRDLRGLPKKYFSEVLSECCLSVWIDDISSWGTFPLESMKCGTPVIGKIPNNVPHWMLDEEDNTKLTDAGIWTTNKQELPDLIATYMKAWFEDNVPEDIYGKMDEIATKFNETDFRENSIKAFSAIITNRLAQLKPVADKEQEEENLIAHG